jgi:hypothetical protein
MLHLTESKAYSVNAHKKLVEFCPQLAHVLTNLPQGHFFQYLIDLLLLLVNKVKIAHSEITFIFSPPAPTFQIPANTANTPLQTIGSYQKWLAHLKKIVKHVSKSHVALSTGYDSSKLRGQYFIIPELDYTLTGTYYPMWPKIKSLPRLIGIDPVPIAPCVPEWSDFQDTTQLVRLICFASRRKIELLLAKVSLQEREYSAVYMGFVMVTSHCRGVQKGEKIY